MFEPIFQSKLTPREVQDQVIEVIVKNFKNQKSITKHQRAIQILQSLFNQYSFDLEGFFNQLNLDSQQIDKLITKILYSIYYYELILVFVDNDKILEFFLLALLTDILDEQVYKSYLSQLTEKKTLNLIAYCAIDLREGSYAILNYLENIYKDKKDWSILLQGIRRQYFDAQLLYALLQDETSKNITLKEALKALEEAVCKQINEIRELYPKIIDLTISLPTRGFKMLENFKQLLNNGNLSAEKNISKLNHDSMIKDNEQEKSSKNDGPEEGYQKSLEAQEQMQSFFTKHQNIVYTNDQFKQFFWLFGLRGHYLDLPMIKAQRGPLEITLKNILEFLEHPGLIEEDDMQILINFIFNFYDELYTYNYDPEHYLSGFNQLAYALSTRGAHFEKLPWLPSVLEGFRTLQTYLHSKGFEDFNIMNNPIIIFDQGSSQMFNKNRLYINELSKEYGATIWHLSTKDTLKLAKKVGVLHWIQSGSVGNFGYGGSRNCTFFLAPIIHEASKRGKKTISEIIKMNEREITEIFDEKILGKTKSDVILHLGEDDVAIQPCNFFADAFLAETYKDLYFYRSSYYVGRNTQSINPFLDLESVVNLPSSVYSSTFWKMKPEIAGMKGMITKPRFCLPVPFGNEEGHVIFTYEGLDLFHQPILHLAGARFPNKNIPTSPLDGIVDYLKRFLPYSMQISMSSSLLDFRNKKVGNVLPWNDDEFRAKDTIHSMDDLWKYVSKPKTVAELKKRFWKNMYHFVRDIDHKDFVIGDAIDSLTKLDPLLKAPAPLKKYYKKIQKKALMFFSFAKALVKFHKKNDPDFIQKAKIEVEEEYAITLEKTEITKGLYYLVKVIETFGQEGIRKGNS